MNTTDDDRSDVKRDDAFAFSQLDLSLTAPQAWALAQFIEHLGWTEFRNHAMNDDEARLMKDAVMRLQDPLARAGYAPR